MKGVSEVCDNAKTITDLLKSLTAGSGRSSSRNKSGIAGFLSTIKQTSSTADGPDNLYLGQRRQALTSRSAFNSSAGSLVDTDDDCDIKAAKARSVRDAVHPTGSFGRVGHHDDDDEYWLREDNNESTLSHFRSVDEKISMKKQNQEIPSPNSQEEDFCISSSANRRRVVMSQEEPNPLVPAAGVASASASAAAGAKAHQQEVVLLDCDDSNDIFPTHDSGLRGWGAQSSNIVQSEVSCYPLFSAQPEQASPEASPASPDTSSYEDEGESPPESEEEDDDDNADDDLSGSDTESGLSTAGAAKRKRRKQPNKAVKAKKAKKPSSSSAESRKGRKPVNFSALNISPAAAAVSSSTVVHAQRTSSHSGTPHGQKPGQGQGLLQFFSGHTAAVSGSMRNRKGTNEQIELEQNWVVGSTASFFLGEEKPSALPGELFSHKHTPPTAFATASASASTNANKQQGQQKQQGSGTQSDDGNSTEEEEEEDEDYHRQEDPDKAAQEKFLINAGSRRVDFDQYKFHDESMYRYESGQQPLGGFFPWVPEGSAPPERKSPLDQLGPFSSPRPFHDNGGVHSSRKHLISSSHSCSGSKEKLEGSRHNPPDDVVDLT